jgi:hypothetical protein
LAATSGLYQRRKQLPALILIGSLALLALVVWGKVFGTNADTAEAVRCAPPAQGTAVGTPLPPNGLDDTEPVAPATIKMTVLNGNGKRRQAGMVAEELMSLGFNKAADPSNDPIYVKQDMPCHGQIRFGPGGAAAARTLSIAVPCAELVRDDRQDAAVDLSLGTKFDDVKPTSRAKRVLEALGQVQGGGDTTEGVEPAAASPADFSRDAIASARQIRC